MGEAPPNGRLLWVLVPWLLSWLAVQTLGRAPDAFQSARPFERTLPVLQWTELVYASAYVFVPLTVLVIGTQGALRRFAVQGVIAIIVVTVVWLTVPMATARPPNGVACRLVEGMAGRPGSGDQPYADDNVDPGECARASSATLFSVA